MNTYNVLMDAFLFEKNYKGENVHLYVLKLYAKYYSISVFIYPFLLRIYMCSFQWIFVWVRLNYTSIIKKTKQATALIFAIQLHDI